MSEAVLPDTKDIGLKSVLKNIKKIKTPEEKYDEVFYHLSHYNGWKDGLKPYLEERIEAFKELTEVNITGSENMAELGIKFAISSVIRKELQDIIDLVEMRAKYVEEQKEKAKKKRRK